MSLENSLVLGRYRVLWPLESKKLIKTYIGRDEHRDGQGAPVLIEHHLHDLGVRESAAGIALYTELGRLTHLRHSGVVSLLDYGTIDGCLVTAHEHQPGLSLAQLCEVFSKKQEPFPVRLAVYIARRLLATLHQCHSHLDGPFLHGRVTLGCVHLPVSGVPQIADFGLAALEDAAAEAEMQLGFFQTRVSYAAPELTRGGPPTVQGDTYSVALLFYRLLAGSNPFRGRSIPETLQRVLQLSPAELLMPEWKDCHAANRLLERALAKDPARRFEDCAALLRSLDPLQPASDDELREELAALVRRNSTGDWAQIARVTRPRARSSPPSGHDAHPLPAAAPHESKAPAFVSGLVTEQPISVTEHTDSARREAHRRRERRRQMMVVPTVLIPAVAIMFGLFLGRLGASGVRGSAAPAALGSVPTPPLVSTLIEDLRARLVRCAPEPGASVAGYEVELQFGDSGELAVVRLAPHELAQSRLGACLLETAWTAELRAPGPVSVRIPLERAAPAAR